MRLSQVAIWGALLASCGCLVTVARTDPLFLFGTTKRQPTASSIFLVRGGQQVPDVVPENVTLGADDLENHTSTTNSTTDSCALYGRISEDEFRLTPQQIATFFEQGCVTIPNVLTPDEVAPLQAVFDRFVSGDILVPGKDFCDMSKPFGVPYSHWSLVNCMLPTTYYPPLRGNIYERLTASMAQQLFAHKNPDITMVQDYDQLLNKLPGKTDAIFAWHQDMAYWPGSETLGVETTDTCTFSLALDDSDAKNGCLRYVAQSGVTKTLRPHRPFAGDSRSDGHALTATVDEEREDIRLAPALLGSVTIHDEYVVHGSGGNTCPDRQRRTYVIAYRDESIVQAERRIGFTHSHNDQVNWDTFAYHCRKDCTQGHVDTP
jgi:phytanoyl-CoA hydroxylase